MPRITRTSERVVTDEHGVVVCDGPGCTAEFDVEPMTYMVPVGWYILHQEGGKLLQRQDALYFHSRTCLHDWLMHDIETHAPSE